MQQMTTAEKLAMVKSMMGIIDTSEDTVITNYLTCAEREILTWRYSYGNEIPESVPVPQPKLALSKEALAEMDGIAPQNADSPIYA